MSDEAVSQAIAAVPDASYRAALQAIADRQKQMYAENQLPQGWRFNKEISLSHVASIVSVVIGVSIWAATVNTHFAVIDESRTTVRASQLATDQRQDDNLIRLQGRVDKGLDDMNGKLDRLTELMIHMGPPK